MAHRHVDRLVHAHDAHEQRLALDSAHATLDELKTLDERVTTLVEEIVKTRVDEAMQRFYNGEVLPDPGSKSTTNDLSA